MLLKQMVGRARRNLDRKQDLTANDKTLTANEKASGYAGGLFVCIGSRFTSLALLRRLQARRVEPFGQMRGGVGASCPEQQILALAARWKHLGAFAVGFRLNAKPLFKGDSLFESSALHDALLWFDQGGSTPGILVTGNRPSIVCC
jgi:hypothetical protein